MTKPALPKNWTMYRVGRGRNQTWWAYKVDRQGYQFAPAIHAYRKDEIIDLAIVVDGEAEYQLPKENEQCG